MRFAPLLLLFACAHPIGGPLEDAREARTLPEDMTVTYRDVGGPLGSREVVVDLSTADACERIAEASAGT